MLGIAGLLSCAAVEPRTAGMLVETAEDERRLWNRGLEEAQRLDGSGRLYEGKELVDYVNAVAAKLFRPGLRGGDLMFGIRIIRNPYLNAFALPHGAIYLHTGILAQMENEAQLAALLGHEMVHVTHRHPVQHFRTIQNTANALAVLGTLTLPAGHYGMIVQLLGQIGGLAAVSGYSRSMERESDSQGFEMMVRAGYDAAEAPKLFDHLKKEREDRKVSEPFFFGSHPRLNDRKENYEELIAKNELSRDGYRGGDEFLQKIAPLLLENSAMDMSLGRWEWAEEALQKYLTIRPADPEGRYRLAEVYRRRGEKNDHQRAEYYYGAALELNRAFAGGYHGLGLLYLKRGDKVKAAGMFEKYLELAPAAKDRAYVESYLQDFRGAP
jgi:beta-barrel assembly-enhancing protease